ncbi:c-type cytochrome [Halomonas rhizosphaerae]|uniref:C-type cytochrome n=1 Tax=Halomonas rhizosphaerae TaxID=3043296 RepID=A0ABT6UVG8_9GAMM|nr:c-type cytochrome [Halomonas rhizosphaerae]MDI5889945.1 c-type cytochrome [Halomonas rhizosphaerae]MDI5919253.1 c-type cytochrome [Halomonas rhizosphaerae]
MKSSKLIMGCLATLGLTTGIAVAQDDAEREAVAERLKPVGELCLQGEDCGTAAASDSDGGDDGGSSDGADGESIYGSVCAACHDSGAAGAPMYEDEDAWADRVDKGWDELLANAINGIGAMPARGGNSSLSDEEVEAAMAHMLDPVMDVPDLGGDAASDDEAASSDDEAASEEDGAASGEEEDAASDEQESASDDEASSDDEAASGSDFDGEALYGSSGCAACHDSGAAGAPVLGDADAWAPRIEQGMDTLYESAINGKGAMPPKGGSSASDEEIQAIVDYMVEESE